jgi:hypothetical protein
LACALLGSIDRFAVTAKSCNVAQRTRKSCAQKRLAQRGTLVDEGPREDQKHNCRRAKQD